MDPRTRSPEALADQIINSSDESMEDLTADTELYEDSEDEELLDLVDEFNDPDADIGSDEDHSSQSEEDF